MTINKDDIEQLSNIFLTRREADGMIGEIEKKLGNDNVRLSVIESQLKLILWGLAAVGGGIITMLIKMFFGQ